MVASPLRRIVTGRDQGGRSTVIIDGPTEKMIWATDRSPADNSGRDDAGGGMLDFDMPTGSSRFFFTDVAPESSGASIGMHATDTLDYAVVLSGEIILVTQTGSTVVRAGDVVVDRGVLHAWRNETDEPCRMLFVFIKAEPLR